jgi:RNA polymerase sigma-70 factor (ECF subfamily)
LTDRPDAFEAERGRLVGLAYRMLGSMADAEDVVQDAWLRWRRTDPASIERSAAWLTTVVSRLALDRLRSAQHQREVYVGPWLPEPVLGPSDPADPAEIAESLTLGFLVMLERLAPLERVVFLLADVFREPFGSIAPAVGRSEAACRQIASRARHRVRQERRRFDPDPGAEDQVAAAFAKAAATGDVDGLLGMLAPDVVLLSDGGADHRAARRPVVGSARVARFLVNVARRLPPGAVVEFARVNGTPGFVATVDGQPELVLALELDGRLITRVLSVSNPDKLVHVAPGTRRTG